MNSSKSLLQSSCIYLGSNVVSAIIPFVLLPILTRFIDPAEYGKIAMFDVTVSFLNVFIGLSTHGAVGVRYYRHQRSTFPTFVTSCFLVLIFTSASAGLIVAIGSNTLQEFTGISTKWLMLAVVVSSAQSTVNIRLVIWQSSKSALHYGTLQVLQALLSNGLSLYMVLVLKWGAEGRIYAVVFSLMTVGLFSLIDLRKDRYLQSSFDSADIVEILKFGIPLIPHVFSSILTAFGDRFILKSQLGLEATGIYFVAVQISMPLYLIGNSFNRAFTPWLYEKLSNKDDDIAVVVSYFSILSFIVFACLYAIIVHIINPLIFGVQYHSIQKVQSILIFSNLCQALYFSIASYIYFINKNIFISIITTVSTVIYILIGWHLTSIFGIVGLAATQLAVQLFVFIGVYILAVKVTQQPWLQPDRLKPSVSALIHHYFK